MSSKLAYLAISLVLASVVLGGDSSTGTLACNPLQLSPCAAAITTSSNPSDACCTKIKQQSPCLCQYMKNPNLQKFINSPGAKKVAKSCGTPFPRC